MLCEARLFPDTPQCHTTARYVVVGKYSPGDQQLAGFMYLNTCKKHANEFNKDSGCPIFTSGFTKLIDAGRIQLAE